MKKPKNENLARNIAGAATGAKGNAGALVGGASTPAFAKIDNINLPKRKSASAGGAGGLSALVGGTRSADGIVGKAIKVSSIDLGNNIVAAGEPTPGGELLFAGGRTTGEREIESTHRFASEVRAAWNRSNPTGPKNERREVGFFATVTWGNRPGVLNFRFSGYKEGKPGESGINLGIAPRPPKGSVVIDFHTHPFGLNAQASQWDRDHLESYATGVVRSFGGLYWYGKEVF